MDLKVHATIELRVDGSMQSVSKTGLNPIFLPNVRNLDGPKVIIGDNLSSHISMHVLKLCEDYI